MTEEERREMMRNNYYALMRASHCGRNGNPDPDFAYVVRCKNCKHCFSTENDPLTPYDGESDWYCDELDVGWHVLVLDPNRFYCANGEKREEEY